MKKIVFALLGCVFFSLAFALEEETIFSSTHEKNRFIKLTSELRCLVCQNQNIAESNAPLAKDLRQQIFLQLEKGKSDQEIIDYLVKRYGDYILYRPPLKLSTFGLWTIPFLVTLGGLGYLFFYITRQRREK